MTRTTRLNPVLRGDLEALIEAAAMYPPRPRTQADFDTPPRDRRERDGEAFDIARPLPFGGTLRIGGDEYPASPGETRFILGVCGVCTAVGGALAVAVWLWSRGVLLWQ